ncbi:MAG: TIGR02996 domain-containing protein [Proteobacteria bacterium]|nr:TIGR02996 domain-containing protein [Pseudomonadota bacterium]
MGSTTSTLVAHAESLRRAIAAAPEDDGPRLVFADVAAELGDLGHAELIQLQIARAKSGGPPSDHEEKLLATHAAGWLLPILPMIQDGSWKFERGFLDACQISPQTRGTTAFAGHGLWSTLRTVHLAGLGDAMPLLVHPIMRNLKVVALSTAAPRDFTDVFTQLWSGGLDREGLQLSFFAEPAVLATWWMHLAKMTPPRHATVTVDSDATEARMNAPDKTLLATVSPTTPAHGWWHLCLALGLGDDARSLRRGAITRLIVRAPAGSMLGLTWGTSDGESPMYEAILRRANALRIEVVLDEF